MCVILAHAYVVFLSISFADKLGKTSWLAKFWHTSAKQARRPVLHVQLFKKRWIQRSSHWILLYGSLVAWFSWTNASTWNMRKFWLTIIADVFSSGLGGGVWMHDVHISAEVSFLIVIITHRRPGCLRERSQKTSWWGCGREHRHDSFLEQCQTYRHDAVRAVVHKTQGCTSLNKQASKQASKIWTFPQDIHENFGIARSTQGTSESCPAASTKAGETDCQPVNFSGYRFLHPAFSWLNLKGPSTLF